MIKTLSAYYRVIASALLLLCLPCLHSIAYAKKIKDPNFRGFYLGLQAGYGSAGYESSTLTTVTPTSIEASGFAVGPIAGYFIDRFFALELGVLYLNKPTFNGLPAGFSRNKIKNNIVYLMMRFRVPITQNFSGFAKFGIGYIVRDGIQYPTFTALPEGEMMTFVYGVGLDDRVYKELHLYLSWLMTMHRNNLQLPSSQFAGLGFYYLFKI